MLDAGGMKPRDRGEVGRERGHYANVDSMPVESPDAFGGTGVAGCNAVSPYCPGVATPA